MHLLIRSALVLAIAAISQLRNKFHGHFATPQEYVILLIC